MSKAAARKRASSPVADLEYEEPAENVPNQDLEKDSDGNEDDLKLIFRIRQASSDLYKESNKPASNAEIADALGEDVSKIKAARDSLKLARKNQRLSAFRKKALQVGYSRRKNLSHTEAVGLDTERTLITPADIKRMVQSLPLDFEKGSYTEDEIKMKMEMAFESIPVGVAREITAFIEPVFRTIINECVAHQVRVKTGRINAATVHSVISKYTGLGVFTGVAPPDGLIRFAKVDGVEAAKRGDHDSGRLLTASTEDKKLWKSEKVKNKKMSDLFANMVSEEKQRLEKKRNKSAVEGSDAVDAVQPVVEDEPVKKKKKKSKELKALSA